MLLGYDIGSSSVKASVVDALTGECLATTFFPKQEMAISSPQPGFAEQNPTDWWNAAIECTHELIRLLTYGPMVIFVGIMLSVFQQAVGINAVLYYAPRIFASVDMANPMVQTVIMGIVNISFTLLAVFTVEKIGRRPLLIVGSLGMAVGAIAFARNWYRKPKAKALRT